MSILHEEHPVLIDIPEQLLRINVANSLKLTELRDMYQAIISGLKEYYAHEYDDYISGYEITYELYPDIFQIQRDLFTISFLQHLAEDKYLSYQHVFELRHEHQHILIIYIVGWHEKMVPL